MCYDAAMKVLLEIVRNKYLLGLAAALAALVGVSFLLPPAAAAFARYFAYIAAACNTIPLPTTPLIIYLGGKYPWLAVALVGAAATSLANLIDYEVFTSVFRTKLLRKIKDSKHAQASVATFGRVAFLALVGANVVVFSWDLVRLVAIAAKYPRLKYAAATFLGRVVRYAILAAVGDFFEPPLWAIFIIGALLALPAVISWLRERRRGKKAGA